METAWWLGLGIYIVMTKKIDYKIRTIRLSDETWKKFKEARWKSRTSWNLFVVELLKQNAQLTRHNK